MVKILVLSVFIGWCLILSGPVRAQEPERPDVAKITQILRLTTGMRFMEETDLGVTPSQSEQLLPLLSEFVDNELAFRARNLSDSLLTVLAAYVGDPDTSSIVTERNRRNTDWEQEIGETEEAIHSEEKAGSGGMQGGGRDGASQGQGQAVEQNAGGQDREKILEAATELLAQIEQLLTPDQQRYLDQLALPEIALRSAREPNSEVVILFAELVEWFLAEKAR